LNLLPLFLELKQVGIAGIHLVVLISIPKIEAKIVCETSLSSCTTRRHTLEDHSLTVTQTIRSADFYRYTVHSKIYVVHTPTNAMFIKSGKDLKFTLKYTLISLLHISVYDHHQGACTAPG
jgi:hypothetical protein